MSGSKIARRAIRRNRQSPKADKYKETPSWYRYDQACWRRRRYRIKQAMRDGETEALPLFKNGDACEWS